MASPQTGNTEMTEAAFEPSPLPQVRDEDMTVPIVVYVLYLLALPSAFISLLIGVIVAYSSRETAGPVAQSHYTFLIRTFWLSLLWIPVGLALILVGIPLSFILIGIPVVIVGGLMLGVGKLWYIVRCVVGLIGAAQGRAYPTPQSLLL